MRRTPSVKTILNAFGEWHDFTKETAYGIRRAMKEESRDHAMRKINELLGTHGVEAIRCGDSYVDSYFYDIVATYCNTGDAYTSTVLYDTERDVFYVTTYADWIETAERNKRYKFQ